jgi:hypothetical protein
MTPVLLSRLLFPVLLVAFLLALEAGRVLRRRHLARRPPGADDGASFQVVQGAVFGLMGLLLAFAFSGASSRFDLRRQLALDEANALGTAWLQLDLLPDSARGPLQGQLRAYAEARIAVHRAMPDAGAAARAGATADSLQQLIWPAAVRAAQAAPTPLAGLLLLPALNEAFDVGNARVTYTMVHLPLPILWVLLGMAMACAVLAGYSLASAGPRDWLNSLTFALVATVVLGVILDFEFPRVGRINLARYDEVMVRAVEGMR